MLVHGTALEVNGQAILLRGASGAGKSDLALRLLAKGAKLIGDDYVVLSQADRSVFVRAAPELHGMLEVRGVGIIYVSEVLPLDTPYPLFAVVDLCDREDVPRMPEDEDAQTEILGIAVKRLALHSFDASTPLKIALVCGQDL
ncbi:HPr kinase/phosphatase C-terminal domain-containing protein [Temperatibacter marinus]|uniref:HPr kinase/phosphatase C-terminal domain-containing protein n=1 Tax=Temperatibacter marinus TaxID=1456591 RepID=A0AA52HAG0_9PROT|nr:HPr kinase/phosphatase C-terminal domain-containing protein [Temperatibacter marinus]WND03924.1 HPr kinase/phosphatase C-terminal domain-containing protein [Temperatibacter marinus]